MKHYHISPGILVIILSLTVVSCEKEPEKECGPETTTTISGYSDFDLYLTGNVPPGAVAFRIIGEVDNICPKEHAKIDADFVTVNNDDIIEVKLLVEWLLLYEQYIAMIESSTYDTRIWEGSGDIGLKVFGDDPAHLRISFIVIFKDQGSYEENKAWINDGKVASRYVVVTYHIPKDG